jgi:hypothetical protein
MPFCRIATDKASRTLLSKLRTSAGTRKMLKSLLLGLAAFAAAQGAEGDLRGEMQRLEASRNAAIRTGEMAALERIYAADFHGIAGNGGRVDRTTLFAVFRRNAGGDFVAESEILSAREIDGLVFAEGRLRLWNGAHDHLLSDSSYLHIFRRNGDHWEMVAGAATPVQPPPQ